MVQNSPSAPAFYQGPVLAHRDERLRSAFRRVPTLANFDAFLSIARKRHDAPDETYMVSTHAPCWRAWPLLVNGRDYFDLAADNRRVDFEVDMKTPYPAPAST